MKRSVFFFETEVSDIGAMQEQETVVHFRLLKCLLFIVIRFQYVANEKLYRLCIAFHIISHVIAFRSGRESFHCYI